MSGFAGAQPKLLKNKPKYNTEKENTQPNNQSFSNAEGSDETMNRTAFNIMYDKRVFRGNTHGMNILRQPPSEANLTPAQREDLRFKAEREKRKFEMIKQQMVEFKKAKNKISPYDLRPGPPARIDVDLTYFLTE